MILIVSTTNKGAQRICCLKNDLAFEFTSTEIGKWTGIWAKTGLEDMIWVALGGKWHSCHHLGPDITEWKYIWSWKMTYNEFVGKMTKILVISRVYIIYLLVYFRYITIRCMHYSAVLCCTQRPCYLLRWNVTGLNEFQCVHVSLAWWHRAACC